MAKCEKREIPQPKPPVEYVLTMSPSELECLSEFLWRSDMKNEEVNVLNDIRISLDLALGLCCPTAPDKHGNELVGES